MKFENILGVTILVLLFLCALGVVVSIGGAIFYLGWNYFVSPVFDITTVTFIQSMIAAFFIQFIAAMFNTSSIEKFNCK